LERLVYNNLDLEIMFSSEKSKKFWKSLVTLLGYLGLHNLKIHKKNSYSVGRK